ncbi:uncharacterized protein LOC110716752 [Chenopodium quinoa]|uniref:uncharacterized protein LOC110716752 n=1 Tax=Chenopodium quinoa TaxID=63459 RepID=UPI000B773375|nr:uncharacterized protein LOC110716752 [Chenopodium quinoa]
MEITKGILEIGGTTRGNLGRGNGGQLSNHKGNGNQRGEKPKRKYFCKTCEKDHPGKDCEGNLVTCRYCQKLGHREYECFKKEADVKSGKVKESSAPSKPPQSSGPTTKAGTSSGAGGAPKGRVFVMNSRQAESSNDVEVVGSLGLESPESVFLYVSIPSREVRSCSRLFFSVPISISGVEFLADLIEFDLNEFDVILGMDWLGKYEAKIDCAAEKVTLTSLSKTKVVCKKEGKSSRLRIVSAMQLQKLVKKGCPLFLCSVQEVESEEKKGEEGIHVVEEFPDVFSVEIPGMPPVRDFEFTIDLVPGTGPISKAPYRMASAEFRELKTQLDDLLEKGYIRPSSSP